MSEVRAGRRRQARERAIGFLYEAETKDVHPAEVIAELPLAPDSYATDVACGAADHRHQIDHLLTQIAAPKWPLARMPAIDRAVLRLGTFELRFVPDVPDGVVLSEAADLAAQYSTDDSSRFVNGVLARAAELIRGERCWPDPTVLLLDCDGLFRFWTAEPIHEGEDRLGLERDSIFRAAFEPEIFHQATVGAISAEEWGLEIARRLAPDRPQDHEEIAATFLQDNWRVDEAFVAATEKVKATGRVTVGLFSNATTHLEEDLEIMGIADLFEHVVNSARIGAAKPDPEAFVKAAAPFGAPHGEILFVDDRVENVEGALSTGLQAVLHSADVTRFEAVLVRYGLLDAAHTRS